MNHKSIVQDNFDQHYIDIAPELFVGKSFTVSRDNLRAFYKSAVITGKDNSVFELTDANVILWHMLCRIAEKISEKVYVSWVYGLSAYSTMTKLITSFEKNVIHPIFYKYTKITLDTVDTYKVGDKLRYDGGDWPGLSPSGNIEDWADKNGIKVGDIITVETHGYSWFTPVDCMFSVYAPFFSIQTRVIS